MQFFAPMRIRVIVGSIKSPVFEFHVSEKCRKKYNFDETLFSTDGNVIFANFHAARVFAHKINKLKSDKDKIRVGQLNAAGLIDEIYHYVIRKYENDINNDVFKRAELRLKSKLGGGGFKKLLIEFINIFPPMPVYSGKLNSAQYLKGSSAIGKPNSEIALEELALLYFANSNPGAGILKELFDDSELKTKTCYDDLIEELKLFFDFEKKIEHNNSALFDFLKSPIVAAPDSLEEQLKYILKNWDIILSPELKEKILKSLDLIKEDLRFDYFGGDAPLIAPKYKSELDADFLTLGKSRYRYAADSYKDYEEPERFTDDADWMPKVVIIAKNIYVWLDQLSKKYNSNIYRLDQIPDEELDMMARWNFTGLWLIGLWERSSASKKIKQWMGNPEAAASAYSLYDYAVASDLGGEEAFKNLDWRAKQRGIRLASDMVPNHTGIFSKWVIERPDFFIQTSFSPFPGYSFTGGDLSDDPRAQIRIEDGYWNRSDAAVVFQRIDNLSGETTYIYHGNDGTNMPWNDTAQLNYLNSEVREAVIQTIFNVARRTSIIRFDAAMTLAKRHYQRLWFPQPGAGGDIPSRSDFAMTREEFDKCFPVEFWREVVDRINQEMPDTLLLAEAFWLMEGYFVRTLGMHRVYNSAFMHMLMKEENAKYREAIKNTLEFNPEILKRYVNFMSNPDEETAIKQFGADDKYFGVCVLMVTLPGLPMFAHGQIEGFTEKYGMEYRRAYYNENPNYEFIKRHEREIFPLMKKRYLFSQTRDFWLFNFYDLHGHINENVFAYSNMGGGERAIVCYNNKFEETSGWIKCSSGKLVNGGLSSVNLGEALRINPGEKILYIFRDSVSNLKFIRFGKEFYENGLFIRLQAFKYSVFMDFFEVYDSEGHYSKLALELNGKGVYNIEDEILNIKYRRLYYCFNEMLNQNSLNIFGIICVKRELKGMQINAHLSGIANKYADFLTELKRMKDSRADIYEIVSKFDAGLRRALTYNIIFSEEDELTQNHSWVQRLKKIFKLDPISNYKKNNLIFLTWLSLSEASKLFIKENSVKNFKIMLDEFGLSKSALGLFKNLGLGDYDAYQEMLLIRILLRYSHRAFDLGQAINSANLNGKTNAVSLIKEKSEMWENILCDETAREYLNVNEYHGVVYYSKENFEELADWLFTIAVLSYLENIEIANGEYVDKTGDINSTIYKIKLTYKICELAKQAANNSGYKLYSLLENLKGFKN